MPASSTRTLPSTGVPARRVPGGFCVSMLALACSTPHVRGSWASCVFVRSTVVAFWVISSSRFSEQRALGCFRFHANLVAPRVVVFEWKAPSCLRQRLYANLVAPRVLPRGSHLCGSGKGFTQIWFLFLLFEPCVCSECLQLGSR